MTKHLTCPARRTKWQSHGGTCSTRPTESQGHPELRCRLSREGSAVHTGKADHKRDSTRVALKVPAVYIAEPTAPAQQPSVLLQAEAKLCLKGQLFPVAQHHLAGQNNAVPGDKQMVPGKHPIHSLVDSFTAGDLPGTLPQLIISQK